MTICDHCGGELPELSLCPHCGHSGKLKRPLWIGYYVVCKSCGAMGPIAFRPGRAIHGWNLRAAIFTAGPVQPQHEQHEKEKP